MSLTRTARHVGSKVLNQAAATQSLKPAAVRLCPPLTLALAKLAVLLNPPLTLACVLSVLLLFLRRKENTD